VVRLASDFGYRDVFAEGHDILDSEWSGELPKKSIIIYRYYEAASELLGSGQTPTIEEFAKGLSRLIIRVRDLVCNNPANETTAEPDGQKAVWPYKVGPVITNIQPDKVSKEQKTTLKVSGHNFGQTSTVAIENEEAKALPVATSMIVKNPNEVEVTVDLKGTAAKAYILRISRPDKRSGTRELKVE
jgi:IPT/TIG domain